MYIESNFSIVSPIMPIRFNVHKLTGPNEARLRTPSPKQHRVHTPLTSTVSGSESEGEDDVQEVFREYNKSLSSLLLLHYV